MLRPFVDGWPLFVNRLLRNKIHLILIGSNAKLLSNDLATHLTGRSSEIELYQFSFSKYSYPAQFENLSNHLLNVSPTVVSAPDLAQQFSFKSAHTARNYVSYLKQAYLLIGLKKYSSKSKIRVTQEKVYAVDVALPAKGKLADSCLHTGRQVATIFSC